MNAHSDWRNTVAEPALEATPARSAAALASREERIAWAGLLSFTALVGAAVYAWGLPALGLAALGLVPVIFILLLLITVGR